MADINYEKAEKEVAKAVQNTTIKSLVEGKSVTSKRAMDFYALEEETPRPPPGDRVEQLISETAAEEEKAEKKPQRKPIPTPEGAKEGAPAEEIPVEEEDDEDVEEEFTIIMKIPHEDTLKKARQQSARTPKKLPPQPRKTSPSEKYNEPSSPLLILRKHILWFKRQHFDDRYERLGTTKEEVFALRRARRLTEKELQRVLELNERAEDLKKELLKKSGKETSEQMIEKEKIKQKGKRFHTRETWVPL